MQEQMNTAMATLSEAVGQDVPTLVEVRAKIEARYAKALGSAELQGQTVENRMQEIEMAMSDTEAHNRLEQIKAQLGLEAGPTSAGELSGPAADTMTTEFPIRISAGLSSRTSPVAPNTARRKPSAAATSLTTMRGVTE